MADTRGRALSPPRGARNRSRDRDRVKERETNDQKASIDREKVKSKYGSEIEAPVQTKIAISPDTDSVSYQFNE